MRLLAGVDAVERRLGQEHLAARDQPGQVPVEEREEQGGDVVAVGVGVGEDDDAVVAEPREVERLAEAAAEGGHEVRELLVLEHLGEGRALHVQDLPAQRQDRLAGAVAPLLGRAPGGVALHHEQLAPGLARRRAVAQLAGQVEAVRGGALARHRLLGGPARGAGPGREDDARDDRLRDADVVVQPVLEGGAHQPVDRRRQLGVVQAVLGLTLELRVGDEDAEHADEALADVVGGQRDPLRGEAVGLDEVADGLADARPQPVLVGPARAGGNAVDVAAQMLVGGLRPLQHEVDPGAVRVVVAGEPERRLVHRRRLPVGDDAPRVVGQPVLVMEAVGPSRRLVGEGDGHPPVEVAGHLQPLGDDVGVEGRGREDGGVGPEEDRRAAAAGGAEPAQRGDRPAPGEALLPARPVAGGGGDELLRQGVDDARPHPVQSPRGAVRPVLELAARVEGGEYHLEGAAPARRVGVDGDAAAVVGDGHRRPIGVQGDADAGRVPVHGLVDGVVDDLPDEVMQPGRPDPPDVHARPPPDRLEAFENGDVLRGVAVRHGSSVVTRSTGRSSR